MAFRRPRRCSRTWRDCAPTKSSRGWRLGSWQAVMRTESNWLSSLPTSGKYRRHSYWDKLPFSDVDQLGNTRALLFEIFQLVQIAGNRYIELAGGHKSAQAEASECRNPAVPRNSSCPAPSPHMTQCSASLDAHQASPQSFWKADNQPSVQLSRLQPQFRPSNRSRQTGSRFQVGGVHQLDKFSAWVRFPQAFQASKGSNTDGPFSAGMAYHCNNRAQSISLWQGPLACTPDVEAAFPATGWRAARGSESGCSTSDEDDFVG